MIIMNAYETLDYFNNEIKNDRRIVFSRYGDGEYFLMTKKRGAGEEEVEIGDLLNNNIVKKKQLICTAFVTNDYEKLLTIRNKWANTQRYIIETSKNDIYGTGAFLRRDYLGTFKVLPYFFKSKILIITCFSEQVKKLFESEGIQISTYKVPQTKASDEYINIKKFLLKNCDLYNNIIFSCGPIGKVLIGDLIEKCNSNLIDFGSMINVILAKHNRIFLNKWSMSWTKKINPVKLGERFFTSVRNNL